MNNGGVATEGHPYSYACGLKSLGRFLRLWSFPVVFVGVALRGHPMLFSSLRHVQNFNLNFENESPVMGVPPESATIHVRIHRLAWLTGRTVAPFIVSSVQLIERS
jgi:hypothetical protein